MAYLAGTILDKDVTSHCLADEALDNSLGQTAFLCFLRKVCEAVGRDTLR